MIPLRFSQCHILLVLVREVNLTGLLSFNFETTQCKNHFDTNLVKIHSAVSEILSFSSFCVDGNHLGMPYCKKLKWLHAKIILTQSGYNFVHSFQFPILQFLVTEPILTGLFLSNFRTTQCKNHFDTKLVKIQSGVIEILSFFKFCAIFSNGRCQQSWNAKCKIKELQALHDAPPLRLHQAK